MQSPLCRATGDLAYAVVWYGRSSGPGCAPLDLAGLFEEVERHRQHLGVVDYCLTQTTLEQVFIALAGQQHSHEHGHQ